MKARNLMLSNESQWTNDRIELYKLHRKHPSWTQKKLAETMGYSVSWVKKWLKRTGEATVRGMFNKRATRGNLYSVR